jgi:hypothetical protein
MNILTLRVNRWHDARSLADGFKGWRFRGQQDASWALSTTLQRVGHEADPGLLTRHEQRIIEDFQRRAHHFVPDPPPLERLLEWTALMQHYGGPTRLIDFTTSFYVAAFFAVEKASTECAIWCVHRSALSRALMRRLEIDVASHGMALKKNDETLHDSQILHRMSTFAESVFKQPERNFPHVIVEVQPFRLNERLAVQQGLFLCPLSLEVSFLKSLATTFGLSHSTFEDTQAEEYQEAIHTPEILNDTTVVKLLLPSAVQKDALQEVSVR